MFLVASKRSSLAALLCGLFAATAHAQQADPKIHFDRDIQPLFAKRCFACHGPDKAKGGLRLNVKESALGTLESGALGIVPGNPDASELLRRISATDESERMPPEGKPLAAGEIERIRRWIADGAPWQEHWSFQPPRPQPVPQVKNRDWVRNPIDAFILDGLEESGLTPNGPADPRTLIRRATYDLTGLPPTPEEVEEFASHFPSGSDLNTGDGLINGDGEQAYLALVDRLLASPRYGERWARHWLDVVRYADTNSFERDGRKPHSWRYRDYVIRSFNDDKPYDQFVREQLAGDELPEVTNDSIIATGYYRLGLWDDEPADRLQAKYDILDDIVATTGQVFLGLTVNCARCHDHKIDPISQRDYYGLLAFFHNITSNGTKGTNVETPLFDSEAARLAYEEQLRQLKQQRDQVQTELTAIETTFKTAYQQAAAAQLQTSDLDDLEFRFYRDRWHRIPEFDIIKPETVGKLTVPLFDLAPRTRNTDFGFVFTGILKVPQDGEYLFTLDSDDGSRLFVDGQRVVEYEATHGLGTPQKGVARLKAGRVPIRLDYFQNDKDCGLIVSWSGPGVPSRLLSAPLEKEGQPKANLNNVGELIKSRGDELLGQEQTQHYHDLKKKLEALKNENPPADFALSVTEYNSKAPDTFILLRGNAHVPGEQVGPRFPALLGGGDVSIPAPSAEAKTCGRRIELANWIASADNWLTARVMVNRVWQHHFGRGIVRSPNNFGQRGDPPTHPELLDWLARQFVERGWRMKEIHRLIMLSNTYRMSSAANPAALAKDPTNNGFWRFDMRRLSAEEVRDSILAVSGRLNLAMYGPGVYPEISAEVLAGQSRPGDGWGKSSAEEQSRRSIYIHVKRSLIMPLLADFDFADTDSSCAARFVTTQPTQALGMLNGAFVNAQAVELANRLRRELNEDPPARVRRALQLALARPPDEATVNRGLALMKSLAEKHGQSADAALNFFCMMVLNLNEFVYLD
jgi:mono/diheme cytochrome c family protein